MRVRFGVIALLSFLLPFSALHAAGDKKPSPAPTLREILPSDVVMGDPKAPVAMIEYASFTCPHCAAFHNGTFPVIKEKYIDTGKLRYVYRSFPLDEAALRATMLTQCVDPEHYYKVIGVLFKTQSNWSTKQDYLPILENIGKLSGLSGEAFAQCTQDKAREARIVEGKIQAAEQLSIQAMPSFLIDGEMHSGSKPTEFFEKTLNDALAKHSAAAGDNPAKPAENKAK